jgi:hypothetical protein
MKIILLGKHSNRTPLSYPEYQRLSDFDLSFYSTHSKIPTQVDFIVVGFSIDIKSNAETILNIQKINPNSKVVVLSEEPLWDTLWSGDYSSKTSEIQHNSEIIKYYTLNHVTTNIFTFNKFPYFITTNNDFFVRYNSLFKQNSLLSNKEISTIWANANIRQAFYAENRQGDKYQVSNKKFDIYGLSTFRTQLAELSKDNNNLVIGSGWVKNKIRQELPDWHLDKLASLNRNTFIVSALENTHHPSYITEKIFDSYSVLGVPLYYASENHTINQLLPQKSYINLFNQSPKKAINTIDDFTPNTQFIEQYRETQLFLSKLFSNPVEYQNERKHVLSKITKEFEMLTHIS